MRGKTPHMLTVHWHIHTLILTCSNPNSRCLSHTKEQKWHAGGRKIQWSWNHLIKTVCDAHVLYTIASTCENVPLITHSWWQLHMWSTCMLTLSNGCNYILIIMNGNNSSWNVGTIRLLRNCRLLSCVRVSVVFLSGSVIIKYRCRMFVYISI